MRGVGERSGSQDELLRRHADKTKNDIRVAVPGIVQSFDPVEQTVTVQPALRERVSDQSGNISHVNLPLLLDVPVIFPRAGGYALTMPVQQGDECLVIFGDMCMDAWFSNGGMQNQIEKRRHDLSDGYAIMGLWSQPRRVSNYSTTAAQLRTEDGQTFVSIKPGGIDISATTVNVTSSSINITAVDAISITSSSKSITLSASDPTNGGVTISGKNSSQSW